MTTRTTRTTKAKKPKLTRTTTRTDRQFVIVTDNTRLFGPFRTPDEAVIWADKELSMAAWKIFPLTR